MATRTVTRCTCGKRMSRHAHSCRTCREAREAELRAEGLAVVQTGRCPTCGKGLSRNRAITGWWQCEQYGAEGFRKDSTLPPCSWQVIIPEVSR